MNSVTTNRLPNYVIWSLNGSYSFNAFNSDMQLFGSVQNLFDKQPPLAGVGLGGTNPTFFDTVGRFFRVGMRANF